MIDNLSLMLSLFPDYKEELKSHFIKDKYLMALANDYLLCKKEVKMLTDSDKTEQAMAYIDTINELEQDLLAILERLKLIKS
jgi:predicted glycosyl hydrolase (DUF1957 family)